MENYKRLILQDFSKNGLLAHSIENFIHRKSQADLAELIAESIQSKSILIAEAGTGIGKTFAYLLPALRSNQKILISTGSKALQDQLFNKDLPLILNALKKESLAYDKAIEIQNVVLLKGRSNYLCLEKLDQYMQSSNLIDKTFLSSIVQIKNWSISTSTGDISQCYDITEDNFIWSFLTSTNDNCLGASCPRYEDCFVNQIRKRALDANVVIVNHHLFFADISLKTNGFGKIIPDMDVLIFDEAHQVPDIACQYYGEQLSSKQLYSIADDLQLSYRTQLRDVKQLQTSSDYLLQTIKQLRLVLGDNSKGNFHIIKNHKEIKPLINKLLDALNFSKEVCSTISIRNELIESCYERLDKALNFLNKLNQTNMQGYSYWFEVNRSNFTFACTPLSVAPMINELVFKEKRCWIFTSATLTTNNSFQYFNNKIGLTLAKTAIFDSPFDYQNQSLLYVPRYLLAQNHSESAHQLVNILKPIIEMNRGRCFFLCTSHLMLKSLAVEFRKTINNFTLFVQGEMSKSKLLEKFIESGNGLLLATNSFWEGIDIKGDILSCVIIDKLPFQSPDDPILKAKIEDAMLRGLNAFEEIQIPEAIITLKQGVGRLIRDAQDHGVIIICDNRLVIKHYGSQFIKSLPSMTRTRDLHKVMKFLSEKNK
ncbi:ATP-dependent DNA helicase [Thorsellia anophelis]|nr:ATP-dependent DNA helicase [Thorsellia anophelis]